MRKTVGGEKFAVSKILDWKWVYNPDRIRSFFNIAKIYS